jgi:hypothetical protein
VETPPHRREVTADAPLGNENKNKKTKKSLFSAAE